MLLDSSVLKFAENELLYADASNDLCAANDRWFSCFQCFTFYCVYYDSVIYAAEQPTLICRHFEIMMLNGETKSLSLNFEVLYD